jgi:hypothetical protein
VMLPRFSQAKSKSQAADSGRVHIEEIWARPEATD